MNDHQKDTNQPTFDELSDRFIGEANEQPSLSMKTNLDPKDVTKDNPYFDKTKKHTPEEIESFKKFFQ
ncbi:hypothetical protein [Pontibacillus salipaludis]|uniref:Uncharacterized protein n=1 Tax=Pontibacillus salipaludis TaxID=1697394 RepID=A0ABQ1Q3D1_9BACI|nr:hypothetical protein [Pontibacillus salipaludis]GGD11330.1 hypothetical protein GCM10011389_18560 [Pontibacillus salipaludis]